MDYAITPDPKATIGYYYQNRDLGTSDDSGVNGGLAHNISNGLTASANLSFDQTFSARFSADLKYRFDSNGYGSPRKPPMAHASVFYLGKVRKII
jgi:hypothetical protein